MAHQQRCPECNGKGTIPCPMDYGTEPGERHPDNCPGCGGDSRARVVCPMCEGTGKVED